MDTLSILILIYICDNQISFTPCFEKAVKACATTTLFNPLAFRVLFVCLSFYCSNLKQKNCCFLADLIFYSWLIYSSFVKQQKQEPLVSREFARLNNVEGNPKFFRQNDPLWKMFDLPKLFTFSPFPPMDQGQHMICCIPSLLSTKCFSAWCDGSVSGDHGPMERRAKPNGDFYHVGWFYCENMLMLFPTNVDANGAVPRTCYVLVICPKMQACPPRGFEVF